MRQTRYAIPTSTRKDRNSIAFTVESGWRLGIPRTRLRVQRAGQRLALGDLDPVAVRVADKGNVGDVAELHRRAAFAAAAREDAAVLRDDVEHLDRRVAEPCGPHRRI